VNKASVSASRHLRQGRSLGHGASEIGVEAICRLAFVAPKKQENPLACTFSAVSEAQGRQDSNLQPPVLETGALPVELRPSVRKSDCIPGFAGIPRGMSEHADQFEERDEEEEPVQEEQQEKGYGTDEGERDAALDEVE
jgi:hypothetical protein